MKVTRTMAEVTLQADIDLEGQGLVYREGQTTFRAWRVRVTLKGSDRLDAITDDMPHVSVLEAYRVKADGSRGAKAGYGHHLAWHNCEEATHKAIVALAREILAKKQV